MRNNPAYRANNYGGNMDKIDADWIAEQRLRNATAAFVDSRTFDKVLDALEAANAKIVILTKGKLAAEMEKVWTCRGCRLWFPTLLPDDFMCSDCRDKQAKQD